MAWNDKPTTATSRGDDMADLAPIYDLMRGSELNERVGGADPKMVGEFCFHNILLHLTLGPHERVLDFGCGIGRVLVQVASHLPPTASVVGMDIMPEVIAFCRDHIAPTFSHATFELIEGSNVHYNKYIKGTAARKKADVLRTYGGQFSKAYAFSVFTHVDLADFSALLAFVKELLLPGGDFMFTCFLLTEFSRAAIKNNTAKFGFDNPKYESSNTVFIGNAKDRLAFIAFDIGLVEKLVYNAGLIISRVQYGAWRGAGFGDSLQDIVVVRRPEA
jgi:SAM-dependent methyltransferase